MQISKLKESEAKSIAQSLSFLERKLKDVHMSDVKGSYPFVLVMLTGMDYLSPVIWETVERQGWKFCGVRRTTDGFIVHFDRKGT